MEDSRDRTRRAAGPPHERPLQPDEWTLSDVPPSWLVDADTSKEARDVDRLQGDADMLLQLQLERYRGRAWNYFADVLARYGYAVLLSWAGRGLLLQKCREKGIRGLPREIGPLDPDDAVELASETVAVAIHFFRTSVLMRNRWDPEGGASLRTFFIGQCLIRFPDVYRIWRKEQRDPARERVRAEADPNEPAGDDPARTALQRVEADEALEDLDPRTATVLRLSAQDLPQEEIARELERRTGQPVTAKSVEAILYRHRRRQKRKGA
jgi:hypothetical protein